MKNLNEHRFEDEWRNAFQEAESSPRADVWARLDAHLANQETQRYKRRLIWYQRIAAAVALLLLSTGGVWYWLDKGKHHGGNVAVVTPRSQTNEPLSSVPTKAGTRKPAFANPLPIPSTGTKIDPINQPNPEEAQTAALFRKQEGAEQAVRLDRDNLRLRNPLSGNQSVGQHNGDADEQPVVNNPSNRRSGRGSVKNHRYTEPVRPEDSQPFTQNTLVNTPLSQRENAITASTGNERTQYSMLAARPVPVKGYAIRTPVLLPQLTDVYLAQLTEQGRGEEKNEDKEENRTGRWQVGLAFAPSYFNPNMSLNENSAGYQAALSNVSSTAFSADPSNNGFTQANRELESASAAGLSYQSGLRLEYALSKKFSLQGGVDYLYNRSSITTRTYVNYLNNGAREPVYNSLLNYASKVGTESVMAADGLGNSLSLAKSISQSQDAVPVQNTYEYLSVPMKLNYHLAGRKLGASIGTGVSADIFIKNTIGNESEGVNTMEISSTKGTAYRNVGVSAWLSMKLQYKFTKRYSAFIEPGYRRAVTSFTNPQALQSHPYIFSIGTGLQVRL